MDFEIEKTEVLEFGFVDITRNLLKKPSGETTWYTSVSSSTHATAILARDEEGKWLVNREYRHPAKQTILGCPGGRLDEGEAPEEGARRELLEETGYFAKELEFLGASYPLPGLCSQIVYYFYAPSALLQKTPKHDPFELIELEKKTTEDLIKEARLKTIDGILLTALSYYLLKTKGLH